jgi:hypothetical protein
LELGLCTKWGILLSSFRLRDLILAKQSEKPYVRT